MMRQHSSKYLEYIGNNSKNGNNSNSRNYRNSSKNSKHGNLSASHLLHSHPLGPISGPISVNTSS